MNYPRLLYEVLHPETRAGVAGANSKHGRANDNLSFASDTASKTGVATKTVEREAARGAAISEDFFADIKGTSLDKGVELDAMARLPQATPRKRASGKSPKTCTALN